MENFRFCGLLIWVWWSGLRRNLMTAYDYCAKILHPPNMDKLLEIGNNRDLKAAYEWAAGYAPIRNGLVYDAVLDYAKDSYKDITEVSDVLDKKADDLMKTSGAIAAALAAAGRIPSVQAVLTSWPVLTAITCLVVAMILCANARRPVKKVVPMTVKAVLEIVELSSLPFVSDEEDDESENNESSTLLWTPARAEVNPTKTQIKAIIAASYYWAIAGTQFTIEWKATLLKLATFFFCVSLIILVVGFLFSPASVR